MSPKTLDADAIMARATPADASAGARDSALRSPGEDADRAVGEGLHASRVENLNQLLADTMTAARLYKKHHWQVSGPTFYQLHLLFDKHCERAERAGRCCSPSGFSVLGGVGLAMAHDVAETTLDPAAAPGPRGSAGADLAPAARPRDRAQGSAHHGAPGRRGRRRRHQRSAGQRRHPHATSCRCGSWPSTSSMCRSCARECAAGANHRPRHAAPCGPTVMDLVCSERSRWESGKPCLNLPRPCRRYRRRKPNTSFRP